MVHNPMVKGRGKVDHMAGNNLALMQDNDAQQTPEARIQNGNEFFLVGVFWSHLDMSGLKYSLLYRDYPL